MKKWIVLGLITASSLTFAQLVGVVQGQVLDSQGNGLVNVEMKFTGIDADPPFERIVTTDEKGRFTQAGLKPIQYEVYCKLEGYNDQIHKYKQPMGKHEFIITMLTMEEAYAKAVEEGLIEPEVEDPKEDAKDLYNQAVPLFKEEKYAEAEALLTQSLEKDPELGHSLKLAAYCAVKTENWENGLLYAERFLAIEPDDVNMAKLALESARMLKDATMVDKFTEIVKEKEGVTPESLYNEAVVALNADDDAAATEKLNELLELEPTYAIAYFYLGQIKVREFEFEEAIALLKKFIKTDPNHEKVDEAKDLIVTLSE